MELGAVIVAAGMSSRMGDFKPMMNLGSISIAQRVIATMQQAGATRVVVVTGYQADRLERHLSRSGVVFLRNEQYETTQMFDSAKIGLEYLIDECDLVLFTPVDVPLFTARSVEALLESGAELACPAYHGEPGHPILMSRRVIRSILKDSGEGGLKGAISRCGVKQTLIEVQDRGILHDADTPEDYRTLLELHNHQLIRAAVQVSLVKEKTFMDRQSAMLLRLIRETRSVRLACQRMQLSYSSGWNLIKSMEQQLGYTVVSRSQGGAGGGKSELTKEGLELLRRFEAFETAVRLQTEDLYKIYFSGLF